MLGYRKYHGVFDLGQLTPGFLLSFLQTPSCSPSDTWLTRMTTHKVQSTFHCFVQSLLKTSLLSSAVKPSFKTLAVTKQHVSHSDKETCYSVLIVRRSLRSGKRTPRVCHLVAKAKYRYAPHKDVPVNDAPHIRRQSHNIVT